MESKGWGRLACKLARGETTARSQAQLDEFNITFALFLLAAASCIYIFELFPIKCSSLVSSKSDTLGESYSGITLFFFFLTNFFCIRSEIEEIWDCKRT